MIPAAPFKDGAGESTLVVFYDPAVDRGWLEEPAAIAETLATRAGYRTVDSEGLDAWLREQATGGYEGTILFNVHGHYIGREAELDAYMHAGGRLVWTGFAPTFLGFAFIDLPVHDSTPVEPTKEGLAWGYSSTGRGGNYGVAPAEKAGVVLMRQGEYAVSFFLNRSPDKPCGGILKLGGHGISANWETLSEIIRVAEHGLAAPTAPLALIQEEPAPAAAPAGAVFVGSGQFRIAREKALEKLQTFQLDNPAKFLLPWARAAAAAGAKRVNVSVGLADVALEHDGRPFAPEHVADPFGALFDRREDAAAVQAATGILAALRAGPSWIALESGGRRAEIRGLADVRVSSGKPGSRIRATWPVWNIFGSVLIGQAVTLLKEAVGDRFELSFDGDRFRSPASGEPGLPLKQFTTGGVRGELRASPAGTFPSKLDIRYLGVKCCDVAIWTWPCSMLGWLDSDELTLAVSQASIVRDEKFDALLKTMCDPGLRLLKEAGAEYAGLFREAAKLVHGRGLEPVWRSHNRYRHRQHPHEGAIDPRSILPIPGRETVARASKLAWWFRASRNAEPDLPLWFSADGGALSTRQVTELANERGETRMTFERGGGGADAKNTVWLVSSGDVRQSEGLGAKPPRFV
ncbi:MAG: hypothetical protein HY925_07895 [Elusimicrobia bacterium]|nr:hypothetical protein [Elusimicrobiota bacterium]